MTIEIINTEKIYKNLGFTEEVTSCDCCGRVDLKGTYAIENMETGAIMYYGCVCAAHRMNWSKKEFVTKYKAEELEQTTAARKEYRESKAMQDYNEWQTNLNTRFDDNTEEGWNSRHEAIKSEKPILELAKEATKKTLHLKYPLVKVIY